jgi:hypothetical protein
MSTQNDIHPAYTTKVTLDDKIHPFIKYMPISVDTEVPRIEQFAKNVVNSNIDNIKIEDYNDLDHFYIISVLAGWVIKEYNFTKMYESCRFTFAMKLIEYMKTYPEINEKIINHLIGAQSIDEKCTAIPLEKINKNIPNNMVLCESYDEAISALDQTMEGNDKSNLVMKLYHIPEYINNIVDEYGPWNVYTNYPNPVHKFIIDLVRRQVSDGIFPISQVKDLVQDARCNKHWEKDIKKMLLKADEDKIKQLVYDAKQSQQIPDLYAINNNNIVIKPKRKIVLNTIDDVWKLKKFPCFEHILKHKDFNHKNRLMTFSILLWFYSIEDCHQILKKIFEDPKYSRELAHKNLRSLLDRIDEKPKYFYGTSGFGNLCIGYGTNCTNCWINELDFPEDYYTKKRNVRNGYNKSKGS